ncbi:MAG TPA: amine oxidase, partial [Runella sp.]|nr:amine oxidase [Runella sp.]
MANHDVIIVGAGMAGLTCATYLNRFGVSSLVLEASEAVGGRVRTDK